MIKIKINLKKRLLILYILTGLLIIVGALFYLLKTNVFKSGADTALKTYTISGRSFDPLAQTPMPNQKITISTLDGQSLSTQTDANGNYSIKIDASKDELISVIQGSGGTEGDTYSFLTNDDSSSFTYNFNIGNTPFNLDLIYRDIQSVQTDQIKAASERAESEPGLQQLEPLSINGIYYPTFFVLKDIPENKGYVIDPAVLAARKESIAFASEWLKTLKTSTGLIDYFPVIIVPEIDWQLNNEGRPASGYMKWSTLEYENLMVIDLDRLSPELVAHEFAHHLDWIRGNESGISTYSSASTLFYWAFSEIVKKKSIEGYAATDTAEMFAEFFTMMMQPFGPDRINSFTLNEFIDIIGAYLRFESSDNFVLDWTFLDPTQKDYHGTTTVLNSKDLPLSERIAIHNSLIYVYKHVAKMAQQIEFFPGEITIKRGLSILTPEYILKGIYMKDQAVVTLTLADHQQKTIKSGKVFIGDIYSELGPAATNYIISGTRKPLTPVPIGYKTVRVTDLPSDYPVPFLGQTLDIKPGSNYFNISYRKLSTQYKLHSEFYPADRASEYGNPPVFAAELTHKTGLKIRGLKQGDIPRYPTEGTYFGYGQYDKQLTDTARANGEKNTYYYKVDYVIGGDDEHLFPFQAKFTGPMGAMPPQMLATFPIPTATTQEIKKVSDIVTGILTKKCDYIKYPNVTFPNMCF